MLKIAYGVQGTGNGHITRARIMASAFAERNDVQVDYIFSGRPASQYFDMQAFEGYQLFDGLSFSTQRGRVNHFQTLKNARPRAFLRDIKALDLSGYDLVLNDFEPVTAWAAKRAQVTSMSISHQAAFALGAPKTGAGIIDKLIMRYFAPSDIKLGVHWYHFGHSIMPPFIHDVPVSSASHTDYLVYLPFESRQDISNMLEPLSDVTFSCFHPQVNSIQREGHITWHPTAVAPFQSALKQCKGVIGNAGFELSSEALKLGKKLLIKPLAGQFEQLSNVHTLMQLGLCDAMFQLDTDAVEEWLSSAGIEPIIFPNNPHALIDWLVKREWDNPQHICEYLWKQVKFPEHTRQRLMTLAF
ncbi:MJ1255/VC2487 family glycosyltransferase [Alteromonas facilis]|uniref:MJ1255/VC2487 family glycosyltransferase n=1 Tax=Alteromonas facilis TaxID=2048004 RepID=UPI000C28561F|nr:MJ1255/VC2487 family glycosyltransferase [Alteromonas facilis]